ISEWHADVTPEDKYRMVEQCQAAGQIVAMAGDGVNDAPVLAAAQVSIAMGSGTDVARAAADMVLLAPDLGRLVEAHDTARRAMRIIRQNLWWAFAYNVVALPLAIAGLVTPWLAGIGMAASSTLVVLNALRLMPRARGRA
uniref:HAD-IC family P-type ATPase n=1 Tax=Undibacterium luofuense TaxID=2828733 RepID=UPI0030EB7BB8